MVNVLSRVDRKSKWRVEDSITPMLHLGQMVFFLCVGNGLSDRLGLETNIFYQEKSVLGWMPR